MAITKYRIGFVLQILLSQYDRKLALRVLQMDWANVWSNAPERSESSAQSIIRCTLSRHEGVWWHVLLCPLNTVSTAQHQFMLNSDLLAIAHSSIDLAPFGRTMPISFATQAANMLK